MSTGHEPTADPGWVESMGLLERLPGLPVECYGEAVGKLIHCPNPGIRQRALAIGSTVLADDEVVSLLRESADDVLRNAGLEILKLRSRRGMALATRLLEDPDSDVVLQAVLALDHLRDPRAVEHLRGALEHEDPNVVQNAIVAIGHLGDSRVIGELLPFLTEGPWLQMATVQALGDLRSKKAVKPLKRLLDDPFLGSLAAEALARIGGVSAFKALTDRWMRRLENVDPEATLGLMAHVIGGLSTRPVVPAGLRSSLVEHLEDPGAPARPAAAQCFLGLGPGADDGLAITIITESLKDPSHPPACLRHRPDLIPHLLSLEGAAKSWGFMLAVIHPNSITPRDLAVVLSETQEPEPLDAVVTILRKKRSPELAAPLLDLYLRLSPEKRRLLAPALKFYRARLMDLLGSRPDLNQETRVLISALLGLPVRKTVKAVSALPFDARARVIRQLFGRPAILKRLPWDEWVTLDPEIAYPLAAEVAMMANLRELLPILRIALDRDLPEPAVIRAVGTLEDHESTTALIRCVDSDCPLTRTLALDSLGRIGNTEARVAIREHAAAADPEEAHIAYLALAHCATEEDMIFLVEASTHPYWPVRLACAEGLGRSSLPESLTALVSLSADPVEAVAGRALQALES